MVHYIRLLSTPKVTEGQKKALTVSTVVAVTTDLGDALLAADVELIARIVEVHGNHDVVREQKSTWHRSSRALKLVIDCPGKYKSCDIRLHVTTLDTQTASKTCEVPRVLDVWSSVFQLTDQQRSKPLVERQLWLNRNNPLQVWEETGDSIAKHVWDASLGFLILFQQALDSKIGTSLPSFTNLVRAKKSVKALELGSGCGTVGIAFAQLVKSDVVLTDLDDASDIISVNVKQAKTVANTKVQQRVLDWSSALDDSFNSKYDLILVSDCIYNPESSVHLVETLQRLVSTSPDALILVGYKRRHSADALFFERMQRRGFQTLEVCSITLPHISTDHDAATPVSEFYTYRLASK